MDWLHWLLIAIIGYGLNGACFVATLAQGRLHTVRWWQNIFLAIPFGVLLEVVFCFLFNPNKRGW